MVVLYAAVASATTYTFTGQAPRAANSWVNAQNWANGQLPPNPLPKGDVIAVNAECYFDQPALTLNGTLKLNLPHLFVVNNASVITVADGGRLEAFSGEGGVVVYGTINVQKGGTFVKFNPAKIEFKRNSKFIVDGTFMNYRDNPAFVRSSISGTGTIVANGITELSGAALSPGNDGVGCLGLKSQSTYFEGGVAHFEVRGMTPCSQHDQITAEQITVANFLVKVDIAAGGYKDGTALTLIDAMQGDASKFTVEFTGAGAEGWKVKTGTGADLVIEYTAPPIDGRVFLIQSTAPGAAGRVLDADGRGLGRNGTTVQLWEPNGAPHQNWKFIPSDKGENWYRIVSTSPRAGAVIYLDAAYHQLGTNGAGVALYGDNRNAAGMGEPNQYWVVTKNPDGSYRIASAHPRANGASLDADGYTQMNNGGKVQTWQWANNPNQKWLLIAQ